MVKLNAVLRKFNDGELTRELSNGNVKYMITQDKLVVKVGNNHYQVEAQERIGFIIFTPKTLEQFATFGLELDDEVDINALYREVGYPTLEVYNRYSFQPFYKNADGEDQECVKYNASKKGKAKYVDATINIDGVDRVYYKETLTTAQGSGKDGWGVNVLDEDTDKIRFTSSESMHDAASGAVEIATMAEEAIG